VQRVLVFLVVIDCYENLHMGHMPRENSHFSFISSMHLGRLHMYMYTLLSSLSSMNGDCDRKYLPSGG
jgi:hypothetical protein